MTPPDNNSPSTTQHRADAAAQGEVRCIVVTVSDSRTMETDESGALIKQRLRDAGHVIVSRELYPNDETALRAGLGAALTRPDVDAILVTGGTGVSSRDRTVDVVRPLLERELPGFGELFRVLSFHEQIGPAAMLSRALAGVVGRTLIVVMPGSRAAVELALTRLLLPELKHVIREIRR